MVAAQSARLRGFVGLARDSKQVSTLGSASTRGNRQANELPAEWSSDQRVFWRVLKPTRPLTGSSIRLLIGMGFRRRSASQAIDLPSDGGAHCLINNVTGELTVRSGAARPRGIGGADDRAEQHG